MIWSISRSADTLGKDVHDAVSHGDRCSLLVSSWNRTCRCNDIPRTNGGERSVRLATQELCCTRVCDKRLRRIRLDSGRALRPRRLVSGQQKGTTKAMVLHRSTRRTHDVAFSLGVSDLCFAEFIESSVTSFSCKSRHCTTAILVMTLYSRPCFATEASRRQRTERISTVGELRISAWPLMHSMSTRPPIGGMKTNKQKSNKK